VKEATRWISQQRGGVGAFGSTQSTILALKALTLFAKKTAHPPEAGELRVMLGGQVIGTRRFTDQDVEVIGLDIPNPDAVFKPGERNEVEITTSAKQPYPFALSYTYTSLTPVSAAECAVQIATKLAKAEAASGEGVHRAVDRPGGADEPARRQLRFGLVSGRFLARHGTDPSAVGGYWKTSSRGTPNARAI